MGPPRDRIRVRYVALPEPARPEAVTFRGHLLFFSLPSDPRTPASAASILIPEEGGAREPEAPQDGARAP